MLNYKYLIVGGGVAGTTAAETIRKADPAGTLAIISDEPYRFYSRLMLSKPAWFLGHIPFDQVWLKKENWYTDNKVDLLAGRVAVTVDAQGKLLTLKDGEQIKYEKLLLATGTCARLWGIPGADKDGVNYLRDLNHGKKVIEGVKSAQKAVSIGGGFVSFEMCDMLKMAGLDVTLVIRENYFWEPLLDEGSGRMIEKALEKGGIKIIRNMEVAEVMGNAKVESLKLKDGSVLECQLVIAGIGTACSLDWLKTGGLAVNRGILTNEYLETNLPDVWAAGDAAEFNDLILGEHIQLGNWVNAQVHGRIAGLGMTGTRQAYKAVSFYTAQGLDITVAFVGDVRPLPERKIVVRGLPESGKHGRIIVDTNGEIIGATLINMTPEMGIISRIIEKNIKVDGKLTELGDVNFDLKTLLN